MHQDKFSRYKFYLLLTAALLLFLVWAKSLLVPMVFGVFTAFLMLPVCQRMEKKGLSKTLSALVAISRAIYFNAKILIMDEPTAALGVAETARVATPAGGRTTDRIGQAILAGKWCCLRLSQDPSRPS